MWGGFYIWRSGAGAGAALAVCITVAAASARPAFVSSLMFIDDQAALFLGFEIEDVQVWEV